MNLHLSESNMEKVPSRFSCAAALCFLITLTAALPCFSCSAYAGVWQKDFNEALSAAQIHNKNIFLLFTGLGWDTASEELQSAIFETDEFKKEAGGKYILLHIDVPAAESPGSMSAAAAETYQLAVNMGVEALPAALLVTKTGQPFAFLPMTSQTKTPKDVLSLIKREGKKARNINTLYAKMQKTEGTAKAKAMDAYIEAVPARFRFALADLFAEIIAADPENKTGLLGKYKLRQAFENASRAFHAGDLESALNGFLVLINEKDLLSPTELQEAYYTVAYLSAQSGKIAQDEAVAYLRQAYSAAPKSEKAADILKLIDSLLGVENRPATDENRDSAAGSVTEK